MPELQLPDLTFPIVKYGKQETPWDLRPLLYHGGASANVKLVAHKINKGTFGPPILGRVELVKKLQEEINGDLVGGGSRYTADNRIARLRKFFSWADENGHEPKLATVANTFRHWTDHLLQRQRVAGEISGTTAYDLALKVAKLLDKVLERRVGLIGETRLRSQQRVKSARSTRADKQNLEETFRFGYLLLDICDAMSVESIRGPLPVKIPLRTGEVLEEWSGLIEPDKLKPPKDRYQSNRIKLLRTAWEADTSLRTRHPLVNLRIMAELEIFISQTGMNLAQAQSSRNGRFHYTSHLDGYQVRRYKNRRGGEVEFDIYGEYKVIFERYIDWRDMMFPDDPEGLLFPLVRTKGGSNDAAPQFKRLRTICKNLGIRFFGPRELRSTRVNWLLRRSQDPEMTAEMAQHTKETLLRTYQEPNLQVAMVEIARFHNHSDPALSPPGPGWCISPTPDAIPNIPKDATLPNCASAAGCLFCTQQRDIDSEDHVWSLATYRYLKSVELVKYRPPELGISAPLSQPAAAAVDRLTAKLKFFETSSDVRGLWVREALSLVEEGDYHPAWDGFIQLQELQP